MGPYTAADRDLVGLLTAIWEEAFGADGITPEEDFFALGGDSMTATVISVQIQRRMGTTVPVRLVFDHPTVAELATAITGTTP
jgi:acyl carrier protein